MFITRTKQKCWMKKWLMSTNHSLLSKLTSTADFFSNLWVTAVMWTNFGSYKCCVLLSQPNDMGHRSRLMTVYTCTKCHCFFAHIFWHYVHLLYLKDLLHWLSEMHLLVSLHFIFWIYSTLVSHWEWIPVGCNAVLFFHILSEVALLIKQV